MAYKSFEYFIYDGISSKDPLQENTGIESGYEYETGEDFEGSIKIYNVQVNPGLVQEHFLATANIVEQTTRGRTNPYFQYKSKDPITLQLTFAIDGQWDEEGENLRAIARWLNKDTYKPLIFFEGNTPDITHEDTVIYYAMYTGSPLLIHNGARAGYISIEMRCNDVVAYSPIITTETYTYIGNTEGTTLEINNKGDIELYPEIILQKIESGNIAIANSSDTSQDELLLEDLDAGDLIYIDNDKEMLLAYPQKLETVVVSGTNASISLIPDTNKPFDVYIEVGGEWVLVDVEYTVESNEAEEYWVEFADSSYDTQLVKILFYTDDTKYVYNNHNEVFLYLLPYSVNSLVIIGDAHIRFRYQFKKLH